MNQSERAIERFFQQRYDKEALFLPSGRMGLFLAFCEWLQPGNRLLMSPINDDVVFFTVLAAGLVPVIGPLDPHTGNLDPDAVDASTWAELDGVLTTNLYGIPDRMDRFVQICRVHNLVLIEDACQALDTKFQGTRIGQFSDVAVFSLSKHIAGAGGVLAFSETQRRSSLLSRQKVELLRPPVLSSLWREFKHILISLAEAAGIADSLRGAKRCLRPPRPQRNGHRMKFELEDVRKACAAGGGLGRFDQWIGIDHATYRSAAPNSALLSTLQQLEHFEENRQQRREGAQRLLKLGLTPVDLPLNENDSLFRVPLFVRQREEVLQQFARRQLQLDYIYDPSLDVYAPSALAINLSSPLEAKRWSRDILPVDPLKAERFLGLLAELPPLDSALL